MDIKKIIETSEKKTEDGGFLKMIHNHRGSGKSILNTLMGASLLGGKSPLTFDEDGLKHQPPVISGGSDSLSTFVIPPGTTVSGSIVGGGGSGGIGGSSILDRTSAATGAAGSPKSITLEDLKRFADMVKKDGPHDHIADAIATGGTFTKISTDELRAKEESEPEPEPHKIVTDSKETGSW